MRTRIIRSQITCKGIEVEWSDGLLFIFDPDDMFDPNRFYEWAEDNDIMIAKREPVSRESARQTLNGCGVQEVSK